METLETGPSLKRVSGCGTRLGFTDGDLSEFDGCESCEGVEGVLQKKMGVRMLEQDSVTSIKDSEDCDCCMLTCLCMTVGDWVTTVGEMC